MGAREPMCWCVNPGVAGGRPGGEELSLVGDGGVLRRVLGGDCCCSCDRLQMGGGGDPSPRAAKQFDRAVGLNRRRQDGAN